MNTNKDQEQQSALLAWKLNNSKGTIKAVTGTGKTRIGVLASVGESKVLVITPTENLRDNEWKNEFIKWNIDSSNVEFICIHSAYKLVNQHFSLVIVDEVHTTLSTMYLDFYKNNTFDKILCLTATIDDEDKQDIIKTLAPVVYTIDLDRALNLSLIAPFKIYNLAVTLTKDEKKEYDKADYTFGQTFPFFGFDLARMYACASSKLAFETYCNQIGKDPTRFNSYPGKCANAIRKRKNILYEAHNKIAISREILFNKFPDKKSLIFSETISLASKICNAIPDTELYHSELTKPWRKEVLDRFSTGATLRLSAVKALNAGFDVPECSLAIIASGTSKSLDFIQRLGRILRLQEDKQALLIQLYIANSQEEKWIKSRCSQTPSEFINWIDNLNQIEEWK